MIATAEAMREDRDACTAIMVVAEPLLKSGIPAYTVARMFLDAGLPEDVTARALDRLIDPDTGTIATVRTDAFPPIARAGEFMAKEIERPPELIHGVLHKGSKGMYGGNSKAFKTWQMMRVGICVADGLPWLNFPTTAGRVLYVNFELQAFAVQERIRAICDAMRADVPGNLDVWNLRGYSCPLNKLIPELHRQIEGEGYDLIIPDPIYKTLAGRAENDNGDIGEVCNEIEAVAVETGAAVMFGHHFAKGSASGKEAIDRVSGAGTWGRDPDSIITATMHEEIDAFTINMILRNFPQPDPFVARWEYPLFTREDSLDPERLKQTGGRKPSHNVSDIMPFLEATELSTTEWQKICNKEAGVTRPTFYRLRKEAEKRGLIHKSMMTEKWSKS